MGGVDSKTTKIGQAAKRRLETAKSNFEKKQKRENVNSKSVDPFSNNIILEDNIEEHVEVTTTNLNLMNLKTVALEADRYSVSSTVAAAIVNALLIDLNLINECDKDMIVTTMKIHNARTKYRTEKVCENDIANMGAVELVGFDGKKTDGRCIVEGKKRKQVNDYYTFTNQKGEYLTHRMIEGRSTSANIASEIKEVVESYKSEEVVEAIASDGTVVNTGHIAGAIVLTEQHLGRNLHWLICLLHENELPLR